ncbi:MAG: 50S ribosomal protein L1 [Planctomycetes bacterium]|jgi:large subunit ribosomal protein L1|nr:50S ribosomal protein L1 [Planctomycetota bacterium]
MPGKHGKRHRQCLETVPQGKVSVDEAIKCLKGMPGTKFDGTVELAMHLGIDPRQADQALRGSISLPNGIGQTKRVIAFCEENLVDDCKAAGAVEAGGEGLAETVNDGWMDFDVAVATPSMMRVVSKLGRVLGPVGLMPSPKAGTVTPDIVDAVKEFAAGKVNYRNDDGGNIHVPVGKMSFDEGKLRENVEYFLDFIKRQRPATIKKKYIQKAVLAGTMTPGIEIEVA